MFGGRWLFARRRLFSQISCALSPGRRGKLENGFLIVMRFDSARIERNFTRSPLRFIIMRLRPRAAAAAASRARGHSPPRPSSVLVWRAASPSIGRLARRPLSARLGHALERARTCGRRQDAHTPPRAIGAPARLPAGRRAASTNVGRAPFFERSLSLGPDLACDLLCDSV